MQQLFFRKLLMVAGVMAIMILAAQQLQQQVVINHLIWPSLIYFFLLSYITARITYSGVKKDNKTFITRFYSSIGIRLVFSIFPLLIYLIMHKPAELPFIVCYLLLYFLFTSFEIYFLVVNLRPDFKKKDQ
jgi:hypothetical protein